MVSLPSKITAGDTVNWVQDQSEDELGNVISSPTWNMKFFFRKAGAAYTATIEVAGTANDSGGWDFQNLFAANLATGTYYYSAQFINVATPTIKKTFFSGQKIEIAGPIEAATTYEARSQARQDLEAVQTAMRAIISGGAVQQYTIGSRNIQKMTMGDLVKLESKLKGEVVREEKADRIAKGLGNPDILKVRFNK